MLKLSQYIENKQEKGVSMNEVKTPKKPLIFYYVMVFLLLMMLNFMAIPWM